MRNMGCLSRILTPLASNKDDNTISPLSDGSLPKLTTDNAGFPRHEPIL